MQIDYHLSIIASDSAELSAKKLAIQAIRQLVREDLQGNFTDTCATILLRASKEAGNDDLVEEITAVLIYAGMKRGDMKALLDESKIRPEKTPSNAGILSGVTDLLRDAPEMSHLPDICEVVTHAHVYLPDPAQVQQQPQWEYHSLSIFASWIAAHINEYRKKRNPHLELVDALELMTPFRQLSQKDVQHLHEVLQTQMDAKQLTAWSQKLLQLAEAVPPENATQYRFLLQLLPGNQKKNDDVLAEGLENILRQRLFNQEERETFSPQEQSQLAEQIKESASPAVEYLATKLAQHSYIFIDEGFGNDEQYPRIGEILLELFLHGNITHIALPLAPENKELFNKFLQKKSKKAARKLFDDDEWALEALQPLLSTLDNNGVPLVLVGSNPNLYGELAEEQEANRLAEIIRTAPKSKTLILTMGYLCSSAGSRKTEKEGRQTTPSLLRERIGEDKTGSIYFLSHGNAWTEDGSQGEIGDFCDKYGYYEPFGFDLRGTVLAQKKDQQSDPPYEHDWDGMLIFTEKDDNKPRGRAVQPPSIPQLKIPVMNR